MKISINTPYLDNSTNQLRLDIYNNKNGTTT